MKRLATTGLQMVLAFCVLLTVSSATAQEDVESLDELLQDVRDRAAEVTLENVERESGFREERDQRQSILEDTQTELSAQTERGDRLRAQFDSNEVEIEQLNETLRIRTGDMGELFGVFRQQAADARSIIDGSLVSAQTPARRKVIAKLTEKTTLPVIADLQGLQVLLLEEMIESGVVVRFAAEVDDARGVNITDEVVRVGVFNVLGEDGYLLADQSDSRMSILPRQPERRVVRVARKYFAATSGNMRLAIDPSRGTLLSLVIQAPGIVEQATYGGGIGYAIILMGIVGFTIAILRFLSLRKTGAQISRQLKASTVAEDNPLGRVLKVYTENKTIAVDVLERKLDEAILRETPQLERFQGIVKVIAGIAPLMGLLGTVVGMIRTFQTITLYGTGDPKLMADGISQALVTTVEGLVVAIPLVFLYALIADKSRELVEILEEQSAGIIARHAEKTLGAQ
jgi:biopolymer transport protein ExbB